MVRVFSDFDGTITRRDVGDAMFEKFGGARATAAVGEYIAGRISAVECFRRESDACGSVSISALHAFLDREEIDPSFIGFAAFCRSGQIPLTIVSDGMDYYIKHILARHNIADLTVVSNVLEFRSAGEPGHVTFAPRFPNRDEQCDRCASCKRNHITVSSSEDDIIVYIGEGYSDRCPARYADILFAKDSLLAYCRSEKIPCHEYQTFAEITERMKKMLARKREDSSPSAMKKRRQADNARRDLFTGG